jgi:hypothetical protein
MISLGGASGISELRRVQVNSSTVTALTGILINEEALLNKKLQPPEVLML